VIILRIAAAMLRGPAEPGLAGHIARGERVARRGGEGATHGGAREVEAVVAEPVAQLRGDLRLLRLGRGAVGRELGALICHTQREGVRDQLIALRAARCARLVRRR
jgi:hypothetical protein